MILGTSKFLSKSGPVDLLIITKNVSTNTRNMMGSSWKDNIHVNRGLNKSKKTSMSYIPCCSLLFVVFVVQNEYIFSKYVYEDEERKMRNRPWFKSSKAWIWISYLLKNMKYRFGKSSKIIPFQVRVSLFFYFRER